MRDGARAGQQLQPAAHCAEEISPAERAYHCQVQRDLPRNFGAHLAHGMLGLRSFRLMNAPTFVPAYGIALSESKMALGQALLR